MAFCDLQRQEWTRVIETTTQILARNPSNAKALYRRATALTAQEKYSDAQSDLKRVVETHPEDPEALKKLAEVGQLIKARRHTEREQAGKLRGFLQDKRLESGVTVGQDGGVRKLRGNESEPLVPRWMKRAWLSPDSGTAAVLQAHIVLKEPDGKELFSTRRTVMPSGESNATARLAAPVSWVLDDVTGSVFAGWNSAARCVQMGEVARFEVAQRTLGPSVEFAIERFQASWLGDNPRRQAQLKGVPQEIQASTRRRQAIQILGLPEELCARGGDPEDTVIMEMELMQVQEFEDLNGDGCTLMRVIKHGKQRSAGHHVATDLCTVQAHFKVSKLLIDNTLTDTRSGIVKTGEGILLTEDNTKEPTEFVLGEEDVGEYEDHVPPCVGRCLLAFPGGATSGLHFEVVLRDGVPASDLDNELRRALDTGSASRDLIPDTTGPVIVRVEVHGVALPAGGPTDPGWRGVTSLQEERDRAKFLETSGDGKHLLKAMKRWRRVLVWLEHLLEARQWRLQQGAGSGERIAGSTDGEAEAAPGASMYDFDWAEDDAGKDATLPGPTPAREQLKLWAPEDALLKELEAEELAIWAEAHAASAYILASPPWQPAAVAGAAAPASTAALARSDADAEAIEKHARCTIQASKFVHVPAAIQVRARSVLGEHLLSCGKAGEALEVLRPAQEMDPRNIKLKDQMALATQQHNEQAADDTKDTLRFLKRELAAGLEEGSVAELLALLSHIDGVSLTWDAVSATGIGKEIGRCAKHDDNTVAARAKVLIAKFHKLAKAERPLWVK